MTSTSKARRSRGEPSATVATLNGGIVRITSSLPLGIDHVHSYLIPAADGGSLLVDTGLGLPGAEERWAGVLAEIGRPERIFVTHFHPDHVGGSAAAASVSGAPVFQGALDHAYCVRAWGEPAASESSRDHLRLHGMPDEEAERVRSHHVALAQCVQYVADPVLVEPGEELGGWELVHLPGHADGHLCLLRDGVLVAGDVLLGGITPNVGLWPGSAPDPLTDYLRSLERIAELAPRLALPGHGEPIYDPAGRAQEILEHHRGRLVRARDALADEPLTAYEVSVALFPNALAPPLRRFALAETLAHLQHLALRGEIERLSNDGAVAYRLP